MLDHYLLDLSAVESRSLNCLNGVKGSLLEPHLMVFLNPIRTTIVANTGLLGTEVYMTKSGGVFGEYTAQLGVMY